LKRATSLKRERGVWRVSALEAQSPTNGKVFAGGDGPRLMAKWKGGEQGLPGPKVLEKLSVGDQRYEGYEVGARVRQTAGESD